MECLESRHLLSIAPGGYPTPGAGESAYQTALVDFHGPDLAGKDGPMSRLGLDLALLYEQHRIHNADQPGTLFSVPHNMIMTSGDWVMVDVVATGDVNLFKAKLVGIGMQVRDVAGSLLEGSIPISALPQLASLGDLRFARPVYTPQTSAGSVQSQGDAALNADDARAAFGVDGTGITVGVLSDSFNFVKYPGNVDGVAQDIATGDLPQDTQILEDSGTTDEGRGMAQLIHDVAPGAAIKFATAFVGGEAHFAENILALAAAGSDIIVDDVSYFSEPYFQDGLVAQAVNTVFAQGIPYFSSAGNSGTQSYESAFVDSGSTGTGGGKLHDFDPGAGISTVQQITIPVGGLFRPWLQWDEPFGSLGGAGSTSDLDMFLTGSNQTTQVASSIANNIGADPLEHIDFFNDGSFDSNNDGQADTTFFLTITLNSGPTPNVIKYIDFGGDGIVDTFATNSSTDVGHHNTPGAIGVAASAYFLTPAFGTTPPALNDFSSLGGLALRFDANGNRLAVPLNPNSPQVTGVDGSNTTFFGQDISVDADNFPNFFGTSAAAPHVAAVAALMLQAAGGPGSLSPPDLYSMLIDTSIDIVSRLDFSSNTPIPIPSGVGVDAFSGAGLVDAFAALAQIGTQVSLGPDISLQEGNDGITNFVFSVTLLGTAVGPTIVSYTTVGASAAANSDFSPRSGTFTFQGAAGLSQLITVPVLGDLSPEADETFFVQIANVSGALIVRRQAVGTILNDDADWSINDVTVLEPNSGETLAVFTIVAQGNVHKSTSINWSTDDDTAQGGVDYRPRSGTITFGPGGGIATVTVPVLGDTLNEATETFHVVLSNPVNSRINRGVGIGSILDTDPAASIYINDVNITSAAGGGAVAVFTVALDRVVGQNVTVHFATADATAHAGLDYLSGSGDLVFTPGVTQRTIEVPVVNGAVYAANKKFVVNLSNPQHANLGDFQGVGTLIFATGPVGEFIIDDGAAGYSQSVGWSSLTNTLAYQLDYNYHSAGNGTGSATWAFNNMQPGEYEVFARWVPFSNRATNAPYTITDGLNTLGTVLVNQQLMPVGDQSNGIVWQSLGMFNTATGSLHVRLNDNANGMVIADAIRLVAGGAGARQPEMDIEAFDSSIASGSQSPVFENGTDFGQAAATTNSATRTFKITNTGNGDLHLGGSPRVTISGLGAVDFTVLNQPAFTVPPGGSTTFDVLFHPSAIGTRNAVISIGNDDDSEQPYTFAIQGTGIDAGPTSWLIDDGQGGFQSTIAKWAPTLNGQAYQGQVRIAAAGNGSEKATWNFYDLAPGNYSVYTTWIAFNNRATNAPYTVFDGASVQGNYAVNQQQAPADAAFNGVTWKSLTTFDLTSGKLSVQLNNLANGFVVADAVRIVRNDPAPAPTVLALHNTQLPQDVNGDTIVTARDLLIIVNRLSDPAPSATPLVAGDATATSAAATDTYYVDVNGDGIVSPRDALAVINYLLMAAATPLAAPAAIAATASDDESPAMDLNALAIDRAVEEHGDEPVRGYAWTAPTTSLPVTREPSAASTVLAAATDVALDDSPAGNDDEVELLAWDDELQSA